MISSILNTPMAYTKKTAVIGYTWLFVFYRVFTYDKGTHAPPLHLDTSYEDTILYVKLLWYLVQAFLLE